MRSLSLKKYVSFVRDYLAALDAPVLLLGHSMSGMVISQVAEDLPERVSRLVYLSAYLPADGQSLFDVIAANRGDEAPTAIETAMQLSADKRSYGIDERAIAPLFYNRCPDTLRQRIPRHFPPQASLPFTGRVSLSEERFGAVARSYVCCHDDKVIPVRHQRRMLARQPCDEMLQLDADHSPFLSCPDTLAAILHSISQA